MSNWKRCSDWLGYTAPEFSLKKPTECPGFEQALHQPDFITKLWTQLPHAKNAAYPSLLQLYLGWVKDLFFQAGIWLLAAESSHGGDIEYEQCGPLVFFLWHAEYPLHVNFWNRQEVEGQANNYKGWFIKNNWHSLTMLSLERNVFSNWLGCYACRWLRCSGQSKSQYKSTQHQAVSDHFSYFCCAVGKLDLNSSF